MSQRAAQIKRVVYGDGASLAISLNNAAMTSLVLDRHDDARDMVRPREGWAREAEDRDQSMDEYAQRAETWLAEHG